MKALKALKKLNFSKYMAPIVLCLLFVVSALFVPNFLSEINLQSILFQYSIIGLLTLGQLCVMLTGGIDLSQGSMLALTSVITAIVYPKAGLVMAILCGIGAPLVLGTTSGLLCARTKMPPFIVTLSMMSIARALAQLAANSKPIPISDPLFSKLATSTVAFIPLCAIIWVVLAVVMHYFLTQRRFGRHIFAVGSNELSANLSGVNVGAIKIAVYMISAVLTAIGALIWTSRLGSGSPIGGKSYEMEAIAAVVVGGGSLLGGVGSVSGAVAGVLIFGIINSVLNLVGISPYLQGTIKGCIILLAVVLVQRTKKAQ